MLIGMQAMIAIWYELRVTENASAIATGKVARHICHDCMAFF